MLELWTVWKSPEESFSISHTIFDSKSTQSWVELSAADNSLCLLSNIDWMTNSKGSKKDMDLYYSAILQNSGLFSHTAILDHIVPFSDPIDYINNQALSPLPSDETPLHQRNDQWLCLLRDLLHRDDLIFGLMPCSLHIHKQSNQVSSVFTLLVIRWYRLGCLQFAESAEIEEYEDLIDIRSALLIDTANLLLSHLREKKQIPFYKYEDWNHRVSIHLDSDPEVMENLQQLSQDDLQLTLHTLIQSLSLPIIHSPSTSFSSSFISITSTSFVLSQIVQDAYTLYQRSLPLFYLTLFIQSQFPRLSSDFNEMKRCCMEVLLVIFSFLSHF